MKSTNRLETIRLCPIFLDICKGNGLVTMNFHAIALDTIIVAGHKCAVNRIIFCGVGAHFTPFKQLYDIPRNSNLTIKYAQKTLRANVHDTAKIYFVAYVLYTHDILIIFYLSFDASCLGTGYIHTFDRVVKMKQLCSSS